MSIALNDVSHFRLDDLGNYRSQLDTSSLNLIFMKYTLIVCEFFDIIEKNKFKSNTGFQLYVVTKGIETIEHIFKFLLLYTCNIDLVYFHAHKAFYYYIEFMDQISKDDHYFLRFSVKDAILFVYKKTIYEIDNMVRENIIFHKETKKMLHHFDEFTTNINDIIIELCKENKREEKSIMSMVERYVRMENFHEINIHKEYKKYNSIDSMFSD